MHVVTAAIEELVQKRLELLAWALAVYHHPEQTGPQRSMLERQETALMPRRPMSLALRSSVSVDREIPRLGHERARAKNDGHCGKAMSIE